MVLSTCQGEPDGSCTAEEVEDCISWAHVGHLLNEFVQNLRLPGVGLEEGPVFLFSSKPRAIVMQNSVRKSREDEINICLLSDEPELCYDLGLILNRREFSSS